MGLPRTICPRRRERRLRTVTILPIKPIVAVDFGRLALLGQDEQPAVAEAFALIGEFTQLRSQSVSGVTCSGPSCDRLRRPAVLRGSARPVDALHLRAWRPALPFFARSSRSAAASSICPSKSFFNLAFSSSSQVCFVPSHETAGASLTDAVQR